MFIFTNSHVTMDNEGHLNEGHLNEEHLNEGPPITVTHYVSNTSIDEFQEWLSELDGNVFPIDNFPPVANRFYYLFRNFRNINENLVLCSQRVAQMYDSFENNRPTVVFRDDPEYLEYSLDTTYEPAFDSDEESDDEEYDYDA